jgi:hypothetical protein
MKKRRSHLRLSQERVRDLPGRRLRKEKRRKNQHTHRSGDGEVDKIFLL